jgi:hypothetical protein
MTHDNFRRKKKGGGNRKLKAQDPTKLFLNDSLKNKHERKKTSVNSSSLH